MEYEWNINGVSENLHYELVYFKELHNDNNWPTMYRAGGAVVSTITIVGINIMLQEMLGGLNRFKTHLIL